MKRKKTKHKGVYKVGDTYYITYYVGPKKYEKAAGPRLSMALKEKLKRETKGKRGKHKVLERQDKTRFKQLVDLYKNEGDGKRYILQFVSTYLNHFGEMKLSQIEGDDLFEFKKALKATPKRRGGEEVTDSNVNRALAGLRRLFNFAIARGYMEESPFPKTSKSGLFYPDQKGMRNFFPEKQMEKIVEGSPEWLKPLVLTAYYTGLRQGELLGLKWEWIDLEEGIIYLPSTKTLKDSTGRGQRVVMQRELIDLFESLPKRSEWVFYREDGNPYTRDHIYEPFKKVLKGLGIDEKKYSWKEIRHTTASLMHRKGVPTLAIKDQLRHSSIKTTVDFYIGSDVGYQREMIEKLVINSGKIVGKEVSSKNAPEAYA